jgi:hypothetical protein
MIKADLHDCNNIASAVIAIRKNHLNIRYAINGTGKSTIASAIQLQAKSESLSQLKPFGATTDPVCTLSEPITDVLLFNEEFVRSFVFQQSEVIPNSFDVFIKNPQYLEKQKAISDRLTKIHLDIAENSDLKQIVSAGQWVLSKFNLTQGGKFKQAGLIKSLTDSGSIFELPDDLAKFEPLMKRDYTVDWVGWKNDGAKYDDNGICPFCTSGLDEDYATEKKLFTSSYSKSNVKNVTEMLVYVDNVKEFMDEAKRDTLYGCIKRAKDNRETQFWVKKFYDELKFLVEELSEVQNFNSFQVKREDIPHLDDHLKDLMIDISTLDIFNTPRVRTSVAFVNERISAVLAETELLKRDIGQLKGYIGTAKELAIADINDFLSTAGIAYKFNLIEESEDSSKTILSYFPKTGAPVEVPDINLHLSWGERNAFALVLFMHYATSQDPGLIILDDPISSFDSNKKYAIISRLFSASSKRKSFYRKTVLMLTHDLQPVIDYVINDKPTGEYVSAHFLYNKGGAICEQEILPSDIMSLPKLLAQNARNPALNTVHRVASLRKLLEHMPDDGSGHNEAYNLLSCLLHGRTSPSHKDHSPMTGGEIKAGEGLIRTYITDFSYSAYFTQAFTKEPLLKFFTEEKNPYFRLQSFRVLVEALNLKAKIGDDTLMKYVDEQFHVENDYIFALDFVKYDTVPEFVIPKCLEFLKREKLIA